MAAFAWAASAAELNTLRDVQVTRTETGSQVVVAGTRPPTFTVFRLAGPDRLVVDVSSADASAIRGHHDGAGPVAGVVASQFTDARASVGRVLLALQGATQYDVRADGNRVLIAVQGEPAAAAPQAATDSPAAAPPAVATAAPPAPAVTPAPAVAPPAPAGKPEDVVAAEVDEREVAHPARRITGLELERRGLTVRTDAEVARFELIELANPPRLAVDVYGVKLAARAPKGRTEQLREVRVGAHAEKVRLVLDVEGAMPAYRAVRLPRGLRVELGGAPAPAVAEREPLRPAPAAEPEQPLKPAAPKAAELVEVKDLRFEEDSQGGRVVLKLSRAAAWKVDRPDARSAVLTLDNAKLPRRLERSLDTSALETPVRMVSAFAVPGEGSRVRVVVATEGALEESMKAGSDQLSWRLDVAGVKTEEAAVAPRTAGFTAEAPAYAAEGAPQQARYRGKRVSFEFKDIDIQNLLRVIAEISKKNIVVADDVKGAVTIRLRNVPWDQALELILRSKGLGREEFGNIIRVAPLGTLEAEARQRAERKKAMTAQEELSVNLIPVNYATAGDMQARVKEILSERGSVTVDQRTNVLIVRDIRSGIEKARSLVRSLDTQTPQVLIESRIVEANTSFFRQLGIQWGGQARATPVTGNPTGLVFPNAVAVTGGSQASATQGVSSTPNWAVNLPAPAGQGVGGALGFVFGSAGGALNLNLRLSAAEGEGTVKTISAPRVTTLDNNTARISQGVSIPYTSASAQGTNTTFIEARLSLEVTPHITSDGSILMTINAQNNQPDPANVGANGQPAIQRKEANTQVLVKDGDTTVIGGIYVRRGSSSTARVPFFSRLPVLGLLFRDHTERDELQELLIFITPRILNRQQVQTTL